MELFGIWPPFVFLYFEFAASLGVSEAALVRLIPLCPRGSLSGYTDPLKGPN